MTKFKQGQVKEELDAGKIPKSIHYFIYMYLAVELIIFLSFIDTQYKNKLFVPNELNLQLLI
jgi:hypothetical protein